MLIFKGLRYSIYIIEQHGSMEEPFNRAKLFNVGVIEGIFNNEIRYHVKNELHKGICYCIILHDVDMLPVSNLENFLYRKPLLITV
jgi:hypothetical protein